MLTVLTPRLAMGPFWASYRLVSVGVQSGAGIALGPIVADNRRRLSSNSMLGRPEPPLVSAALAPLGTLIPTECLEARHRQTPR